MRVTIKDCDVQYYKGSGPGGQHRNKTETGVRIIHRPSGARAECCETLSQHENKRRAFVRMAQSPLFRLWALGADEMPERTTSRVRTYNIPDQRVTDHRTGKTSTRVTQILDGDLDLIR
jgi:peptide chain release factor 1